MKNYEFLFEGTPNRLDKFLVAQISDMTRTQIQLLIEDGNVTVNNQEKKANYQLKPNDHVVLTLKEPETTNVLHQDIPLDIYYEDSDLIVVNKPSGMVVHPAAGNKENTLVNALLYHCKDLSGINGTLRAGIVHRIDKDTSGLLVACKNDFTHKHLSKQFAEKTVKREYIAICCGVIPHNVGLVDAPIARDPEKRQQMGIVSSGKKAITHFQVIERFKHHTLVKLVLETGRTHQIRVHMKYIGYPICGDPIYGPRSEVVPEGQYLHAKSLGFYHPRLQKMLEFEAPLPAFFQKKLNELSEES
ncbi:MAG: RluA family pseudouridine synthase [Bacilli bacterium]|nr:RluA family pseudouridine synthase [Bacilli bacterium]